MYVCVYTVIKIYLIVYVSILDTENTDNGQLAVVLRFPSLHCKV